MTDRRADPPPAPPIDPAVTARRRAVIAAGHAGELPTVTAHVDDPSPEVRAATLGALARCGALHASRCNAAFADPSPVVRRRAAELAAAWRPGTHGDADEPLALDRLLDDPDPDVVEVACFAVGERISDGRDLPADDLDPGERRLVGVLSERATGHDDPLVREAAVAALGAIGHPDGLAAILAATTDKPAVRRRAVLALAPFDGPDVDAALVRALEDRDWQTRQYAELLTDDT